MPLRQRCRISDKGHLGRAVRMELEVGDMVEKTFTSPGQFVHITCDGHLLRRPISVCACQDDRLTIVFEPRGDGTRWLADRREGEYLDVMGLLGNGFSMEKDGRYLLAGGGIGVPPLYGCAQYSHEKSVAVLGFRSQEMVILEREFGRICEEVSLYTDDGSAGIPGFVHQGVERTLVKDTNFTAILACGPTPMLKGVVEVAKKYGIPCQVSMEERMACGIGACLGCAIQMKDGSMKHVCKDGPVFNAEEVDWDAK